MNIRKLIWYWGPPLALMMFIFYLSSRQRVSISEVYTINFVVFKSLHIIEYAILYFFVFRALYNSLDRKNMRRIYLLAIAITFLYAVSDEVHQTFVPTRNGSGRDIVIDSIGIFLSFQYTKNYLDKLKFFL